METISYMESVLLGDPFGFLAKWPAVLSRLPNLALCNRVGSAILYIMRLQSHLQYSQPGALVYKPAGRT